MVGTYILEIPPPSFIYCVCNYFYEFLSLYYMINFLSLGHFIVMFITSRRVGYMVNQFSEQIG